MLALTHYEKVKEETLHDSPTQKGSQAKSPLTKIMRESSFVSSLVADIRRTVHYRTQNHPKLLAATKRVIINNKHISRNYYA